MAKFNLSSGIAILGLSASIAIFDLSAGIAIFDLSAGIAIFYLSAGIAIFDLSAGRNCNIQFVRMNAMFSLCAGIAEPGREPRSPVQRA